MLESKTAVKDFWENASCGEDLYLKGFSKEDYAGHSQIRYDIEPIIIEFGEFDKYKGKKTLEIGVGLGSDHQLLAEAGANLTGIDITPRAIGHTERRFELFNLETKLMLGDAENLSFEDESFDAVYSYGVLHHTPNTAKAVDEVFRILRPGGFAKIMVYNKHSIVGYMLWLRYALLRLRPWIKLEEIYDKYLESPGTKAYTYEEANQQLFKKFNVVSMRSPLGHGDLLESEAGQRHRGMLQDIARKIWPRTLIKKMLPNHGLGLLIHVEKPI